MYTSVNVTVATAESPMSPGSASGAVCEPPPHASVPNKQTAIHAAPPMVDLERKDKSLVPQQPSGLAVHTPLRLRVSMINMGWVSDGAGD
ncbi:MAG TPA: hypothetical protein VK841_03380, partial [Polyangiaceae bacterium]|nr:hypothetical protein [Polyangiaceae bacterium]